MDKLPDTQMEAKIEAIVERKLLEILGDPDYGLELKKDIEERLKHSLKGDNKSIRSEKPCNLLQG